MPVALPHVKAGKLRALAVTGAKSTPLVPGVPSVAEAGVAGYAIDSVVFFVRVDRTASVNEGKSPRRRNLLAQKLI
jgi:tripartite-type tricarboxylate transporter receptor subunit TctC